jgi:hypothetical protein
MEAFRVLSRNFCVKWNESCNQVNVRFTSFDAILLTVYYDNLAHEASFFLKHDRSPCVSAFHTRPLQLAILDDSAGTMSRACGRTGVAIYLLGHQT